MTLQEAIKHRISRRTYLETPICPSKLEAIQQQIDECNRKGNLSITLIEKGGAVFEDFTKSYGMFKGVSTIIALKGKKDVEHLKEKCGYFGEYLVLEATASGLGTCWVGGTFDKNNPIFHLAENEKLVAIITIGNVDKNTTFKEDVIHKINHRKSRDLERFYIAEETPPYWFLKGIKAVQRAPSAVNRQKYKFTYKDGIVTAFSEDNTPSGLIDLGIAKANFAIAANGRFEFGNGGVFRPNLIA